MTPRDPRYVAWIRHYIESKPRPGGIFIQRDLEDAFSAGRVAERREALKSGEGATESQGEADETTEQD